MRDALQKGRRCAILLKQSACFFVVSSSVAEGRPASDAGAETARARAEGRIRLAQIKSALKGFGERYSRHRFLFEELVKRDFKHKYQQMALGMGWSILNPLLQLLVLRLVFTQLFGRGRAFYSTYMFVGVLIFTFFSESTKSGMRSLVKNKGIINKVFVPKYLFLLSQNVSAVINFLLTLVVFLGLAAFEGIPFSPRFLLLFYPIVSIIMLSLGVGMILSIMFVYFRDIEYLYGIFMMLLRYLSAIFYYTDSFSAGVRNLFMLNPLYDTIAYIRVVVIDGQIPSIGLHAVLVAYPAVVLMIGGYLYIKKNQEFLYHL